MKHSKYQISRAVTICVLATLSILSACTSTPSKPIIQDPAKNPVTVEVIPQTTEAYSPITDRSALFGLYGNQPLTQANDDPRLQQANQLILNYQPTQAWDILNAVESSSLPPDQLTRKRILQAVLMLQAGGYYQADQLLSGGVESKQASTLSLFYLLRAEVALNMGNITEAFHTLSQRSVFLSTIQQQHNQSLIWHTLLNADKQQLRQLQSQDLSAEQSAWLSLALQVQSSKSSTDKTRAINNWRINHLEHPASSALLDQISTEAGLARTPKKVAFLLPLTSAYGQAANAIRDGFEAINNELTLSSRYQLRFYDYGRDPEAAVLYYNQAKNDGADIIIGPLGRKAVDSLLMNATISTTTLLLSPPTSEQFQPHQNLFQFSLSQKLEARLAAQRAWVDGHRQGVILAPQSANGQRMAAEFSRRYSELGGSIVSHENYATNETDFSPVVRSLLGVDASEQRITEMKRLLGGKMIAEARRRQDIGFIFLPAANNNARLIKPVLDYFYALNLPVYSTSRIFSGKPDPINDRDLDQIQFPDMPWMIARNNELDSLRTFLQGSWPNKDTSYNRLYALGMDLVKLMTRYRAMRENSYLRYSGLTGVLNIDDDGVVHREMLWAEFIKGKPLLTDSISTYQGRFSDEKKKTFPAIPAISPAARQ